ncbi:alanine dehydrogenase [Alicyclobacillus cellulosilyticus]|uniref:Alanine dehydrogenase n=1 Tax=Alicyclobacillus cellulosilyticus TaxID=1003997 RepID=A0A917NGV3_9BACL|nr:alanine dehydrogenase [Alicyclobacillus cellulosilyticus]GGJ00068.1 alanine dehydrogenase [Alicyclobacillus cellulosilyticus]
MRIGVPKERKVREYRVSLTPAGVQALVAAGQQVFVETNAGAGSGFADDDYRQAGAILCDREEAWAADIVVKVKEPLPEEHRFFREGMILFTYLHLAAAPDLTRALCDAGVTAVAYETVQLEDGSLPLLAPMSEVAGRMSVQIGARLLEKEYGGAGVLLGGVPGVPPAKVAVIGAGTVGTQAARMAVGMGADVTVLDISAQRLGRLDEAFQGRIKTVISNAYTVAEAVRQADLLIGAVLVPGARAPKIVSREMVAQMRPGCVVVDVSVDQGGCIETIDRVTTHDDPTYLVDGVVHYAVANIPGAVPRTSTLALANATLPYLLQLAMHGEEAIRRHRPLRKGLNVYRGHVTAPGVSEALGVAYHDPETLFAQTIFAV